MLTVLDGLNDDILGREASHLHELLPGPTLVHLPGRRTPPLFVSVLLHGDETSGWDAVRSLLRDRNRRELPRALSVFIGNVTAAREGRRFLDTQPDFNRIWGVTAGAGAAPEYGIMGQVVEAMRARGAFASIDIHNNTGLNPHYACVRRLDHGHFHLATLFSRTVVYFRKPEGVQVEAFADLCPAVTVECGQSTQMHGAQHVREYLHACLNLAEIPRHAVAPHDIDLYHTVVTMKVPEEVSVGFDASDADIRLVDDLDRLNFRELPVNTTIGWIRPGSTARLRLHDEQGREVGERFLRIENGEIRTTVPVMPSMLTNNLRAIRQDCLGYLMESRNELLETAVLINQPGTTPDPPLRG